MFRLRSYQGLHKITYPSLQHNPKQNGSLHPHPPGLQDPFSIRSSWLAIRAAGCLGQHTALHQSPLTRDVQASLLLAHQASHRDAFALCPQRGEPQLTLSCRVGAKRSPERGHRACPRQPGCTSSWGCLAKRCPGAARRASPAAWVSSKEHLLMQSVTNAHCRRELHVLCCMHRLSQCPQQKALPPPTALCTITRKVQTRFLMQSHQPLTARRLPDRSPGEHRGTQLQLLVLAEVNRNLSYIKKIEVDIIWGIRRKVSV